MGVRVKRVDPLAGDSPCPVLYPRDHDPVPDVWHPEPGSGPVLPRVRAGAPSADAPAAETRKTVTVLFADVTGSTALGERLDPEALRALMGRYFATMKRIIERHGGTVEKFIGDAVMAVFGIPQSCTRTTRCGRSAPPPRSGTSSRPSTPS